MPFVLLYKPGLCISLYKYSKLLEFITLVRVDFFLLLCWLDVVMLLCGLWGDDDKVCYVNREFWGCGGIMVQKCSFLLFFVAFFPILGWPGNFISRRHLDVEIFIFRSISDMYFRHVRFRYLLRWKAKGNYFGEWKITRQRMLYATYGISGGRDRGPRPFFFTIYRWHFDALELISRAKYALFSRIFSRTLSLRFLSTFVA